MLQIACLQRAGMHFAHADDTLENAFHEFSTGGTQKVSGMFRSTIRLLIPLEKQSEAMEILGSISEQIQFEPGCISYRLYRSVDDEGAIMIEELWMSEEDLQHHLQSDKYRRILLVIEMAEEPPEIRFDLIAHSSGVETIEKARNHSG